MKELILGVYSFSNYAASSFLIVGKERTLLFDTGYGMADLKHAVEEITKLPLYVVNSHGHFDHTVGNSRFPGRTVKDIMNALNNENVAYPLTSVDLEKSAARMIQMAWRLGK